MLVDLVCPPWLQVARSQLLEVWRLFEGRGRIAPAPLMARLLLLHSCLLVKPLVAMGDDEVRCGV